MAWCDVAAYSGPVEVVLKLLFYMLCILLPLHMLMTYQFHLWQRERSARRHGIVIHRFEALDDASEVIGSYCGTEIHRTVTFDGMRYEFFGVVPENDRRALHRDELYLDPGLLYVSRDDS